MSLFYFYISAETKTEEIKAKERAANTALP